MEKKTLTRSRPPRKQDPMIINRYNQVIGLVERQKATVARIDHMLKSCDLNDGVKKALEDYKYGILASIELETKHGDVVKSADVLSSEIRVGAVNEYMDKLEGTCKI